MSVLFVAVPVAVLLACAGVMAFLWAARHGQLDDLDTPPLRMLLDDDAAPAERAVHRPDRAGSPATTGSDNLRY
jgi:cbb3-type cytochrome oxidase maturation protein